jgi:hypothetical protein
MVRKIIREREREMDRWEMEEIDEHEERQIEKDRY